jgi:hypothetical protein
LPPSRDEPPVALTPHGGKPEGAHPVTVLERQLHAEVSFETASDGVAGESSQQLPAFDLRWRRNFVVGELAVGGGQGAGDLVDHPPGVREGGTDAVDEVPVGNLAAFGGLQ